MINFLTRFEARLARLPDLAFELLIFCAIAAVGIPLAARHGPDLVLLFPDGRAVSAQAGGAPDSDTVIAILGSMETPQ